VLLGRRGPHQIMMTPKELGELGELQRASPHVARADLPPEADDALLEPGLRKSVNLLRQFAAIPEDIRAEKPVSIEFAFCAQPVELLGEAGKVTGVVIEETEVVKGKAVPTGRREVLPADLVVACIGYRTVEIPGVPFEERAGRFANDEGRILPGLYCVGWARRGPSGTIGTNRPDGYAVIDKVMQDLTSGALGPGGKAGREGFDAIAEQRDIQVVTFRDWKRIEEAEEKAARDGAPREKFVDVAAMIKARGDD
jgi:NADPH-dependent glutamate synthase beta subunit-like oxidoreductase